MIDSISSATPKSGQGIKPIYFVLGLLLASALGGAAGAWTMRYRANLELIALKANLESQLQLIQDQRRTTATAALYFYDQKDSLTSVARKIDLESTLEESVVRAQLVITAEEAGQGLSTKIPKEAKFLTLEVSNDKVTLRVSGLGQGADKEAAERQITAALKAINNTRPVEFLPEPSP